MKPGHAWLLGLIVAFCGCTGPALRSQSPEQADEEAGPKTRLVGDVARAAGNGYVKVEGVALVTGLQATGEDPAPSPQRAALLHDMQTRNVKNPSQLLASPNTALVLVRGFLPPGAQKGDKFDLEVQTPSRSETSSLRGGWVMETRLTELAVLGNEIHEGHPLAIGEGPVLVDPSATDKDRALLVRGRVLGGGRVLRSRSLELVIMPEEKSFRLSSQIGDALNKRFHTYDRGVQKKVANPQTDERIALEIHPRYRDNVSRYLRVVRSIAIKETPAQRATRLKLLERQLLDPITAATSALRLEAIGQDGIPSLAQGLKASDVEVRFYSAEALAYLDQAQAAGPLANAARDEPALRAYALAALSAMDDVAAYDQLVSLLEVPSAETRYGAFRALWAMNANDSVVRGETLGQQFSYHVLNTGGPPMVHVTRSYRPEVVLFGHEQRLKTPMMIEAGKSILIRAERDERVTVSKFAVNEPDQKRVVSTKLDEVIRAIVDLGGTYPDVVQALQQAKSTQALAGRFAVDAVPDSTRGYTRPATAEDEEAPRSKFEVANPLPELFFTKRGRGSH